MNKLKLTIVVCWAVVVSHGLAQQYVPPPPSQPSSGNGTTISPPRPSQPRPGTGVSAPQAMEIKFNNGARVALYRDKIVLIEPNGHQYIQKRPLPDVARNPNGCAWLRHYLDGNNPYELDWREKCLVYLYRCMDLR